MTKSGLLDNAQEWKKLHDEACARGEESYLDPKTGYIVFTELKHLNRGHCCESGCRHCPYPKLPIETE